MILSNFIILNKPSGPTSNDCLRQLKKCLPRKTKMGFCGTLDPFAEGVLPVAIGEATKIIPYLHNIYKTYHFTIEWGRQTDTDDREGVVEQSSSNLPTLEDIKAVLPYFIGPQMQMPPIYSAKKIEGERACDRVRRGEEVVLQPCPIHIYDLRILKPIDDKHILLSVTCGPGTYVRRLARDLAHRLGTYGHVTSLLRTEANGFDLNQTVDLETLTKQPELCQEKMVPISAALLHLPHYMVAERETKAFRQGQQIDLTTLKLLHTPKEGYQEDKNVILCLDYAKKPIGLAKMIKKSVQPIRIFHIM